MQHELGAPCMLDDMGTSAFVWNSANSLRSTGTTGSTTLADKQKEPSKRVRGAAGQAAAAIRGVKAPTALVNAKGNWLTTMGSKVMQQKQRRVRADGEELRLPEGVTASATTGKLHFAVTFKFNEVCCRCPCSCSVARYHLALS